MSNYWASDYFAAKFFGSNAFQAVLGSAPPVPIDRITVGPFVGADFVLLSAAIASIVGPPLVNPTIIEVHADTVPETIVLPPTLLPTATAPLVITSFRQTPTASLFGSVQSVSGSYALYPPPSPRVTKAQMNAFTVQSPFTLIDSFQVNGGSVTIETSQTVTVHACKLIGGEIRINQAVATVMNATVANCEIQMGVTEAGIDLQNVSGVRLFHNTVLQRRFDAADLDQTSAALQIRNSSVEAKNNLFAGQGSNAFAVRVVQSAAGSVFGNNFYASFDGAKRFSFGTTQTDEYPAWQAFMPSDVGGLVGDPEFRDRSGTTSVDIDISNTSLPMAAAPALAEIRLDTRLERRPIDFVTMGAHEHAEVITESGQKRFLELLSGISTEPVTKAVLGNSVDTSLFDEFPAQLASDSDIDEIFSPVDIEGIVAPGLPGKEGMVVFRPYFQVSLPNYGELLDTHFDRANEVGLVSADNNVFMIKRMKSIPFDATGFLHTQFTIPVEITS
jgi:hypothetical protein